MSQAGQRTVNGQTPMFSNDMFWASNFNTEPYFSPYWGQMVDSGEHDFNARKPVELEAATAILSAPSPGAAKALGTKRGAFTLRPGWDHGGRVRAMQDTLLGKFAVPEMTDRLLATGTLHLVETNYWHDNFWGSCFGGTARCRPACAHPGVNMLGELLMALRAKKAAA
ncbi:NADAR family protein [Nocardioides sp. InS609-2]|uniref:NADAR family protein n=1 Tax=Nocardioides sp. InS609-2 TaxID=2760705 RepID=UPI0020BE1080|nr:NADAR family protein [Nocardioides sp. InS609-2]